MRKTITQFLIVLFVLLAAVLLPPALSATRPPAMFAAASAGQHVVLVIDGTVVYDSLPDLPTETPTPPSTPLPTETPAFTPTPTPGAGGIFLDAAAIFADDDLVVIREWAERTDAASIKDQENQGDVVALSAAVLCARGDEAMCAKARSYLATVPETENGGRTLALGRNLLGYVLAADLIDYREPEFVSWLWNVRHETLDGRTLITTHEKRPNNWGTHAGASRIVAAIYLGDHADLARAASVFWGWLGNRSMYAGFSYSAPLSWHAQPAEPRGVNPAGSTIQGYSVDGVLPDDQRRGGGFSWPPPCENYVWEALQGAVAQAWMLDRAGYPAFEWEGRALLRSIDWLHMHAGCPAVGDDTGTPYAILAAYGVDYTNGVERPGKNAVGILYRLAP